MFPPFGQYSEAVRQNVKICEIILGIRYQLHCAKGLQASGFRLQASGFRLQASGMGLFYLHADVKDLVTRV
jgi:hypothetical protein